MEIKYERIEIKKLLLKNRKCSRKIAYKVLGHVYGAFLR